MADWVMSGGDNRLVDVRCKKCNKLLMKGQVVWVKVKCTKCGYINDLQYKLKLVENK